MGTSEESISKAEVKVIILAGGFATRLWPLTEKTAKPLILIAGKPLISWIVDGLPDDLEIIVSTNAFYADDFREWREAYPKRKISIFIEESRSEEKKMGALFAVALVLEEKKISDDLLVVAGDNYFGFSIPEFIRSFMSSPKTPLLAAYDIREKEKAKPFGVVVPEEEHPEMIREFQEKPENPKSTLVSTGCYAFPAHLIPETISYAKAHRDDLGKIFEHFLSLGIPVRMFTFQGKWFDVGFFSSYLEANEFLLRQCIKMGKDVSVSDEVVLSGSLFLGDGARIRGESMIENSIVLEGAVIESCRIRNSVVGKNTTLIGMDLDRKIIRDESFLMRD